jgi:O-antigen/teichoic acid export membrane protein
VRNVFGHALIFGFAPLLQKLVAIVLLPLYTHYLTPGDYGEIELLTMVTGLLGLLLRMELRAGFMQAWLAAPDREARAGLLTGVVAMLFVLGIAGAVLFFAAAGMLCDAVLGYRIGAPFALLLSAGLLVDVVSTPFHAALQAQLRSRFMVALSVVQFAVGAGLTIFCVVCLRAGPIGFFVGGVAAAALGLAAMAARYLSEFGLRRAKWRPVRGFTASVGRRPWHLRDVLDSGELGPDVGVRADPNLA